MRSGRFFSLALKDDRVEQCLRSCGNEFSKRKYDSNNSVSSLCMR